MQFIEFTRNGRRYSLADEGKPNSFALKTSIGESNVDVAGDGSSFAPYVVSGASLRYGDSECVFEDGWQTLRRLGANIVSRSRIFIQRETSPGVWSDVPHGVPTRNVMQEYPREGRVTAYLDFPDIQGYASGARFQIGVEAGGGDDLVFGYRMRSPVAGTFRLEWVLDIPDNAALEWITEPTSRADPTPIRTGARIGPAIVRWSRAESPYRSATVEDDGLGGKILHVILGPYTLAAQEWLTVYPDIVTGSYTAAGDACQFWSSSWDNASSVMYFGRNGGGFNVGTLRFTLSGAIPSGATISSTILTCESNGDRAISDAWIYVEESADSAQYTVAGDRPTWANSGSTVTYPTTEEGSGAVHWQGTWPAADVTIEIEIKGLIQHLVDTYSGLASGAHVIVMLNGDDSEGSNDENGMKARPSYTAPDLPTLSITYTTGGGGATGGGPCGLDDRFRFRPSQRV